jgi:hypothetical protein
VCAERNWHFKRSRHDHTCDRNHHFDHWYSAAAFSEGHGKQACEKARVPDWPFHDLRRTAVRIMIRAASGKDCNADFHKTTSMLWRYSIMDARDIK